MAMYYLNVRHNTKKDNSSKNTFHYLTRTAHFAAHKDQEELELSLSGNLPDWAQNAPEQFWAAADRFEIERGRTSAVITVALPKELSRSQRAELVHSLIQGFTAEHQFPYTAAVHQHPSALTGEEQPHLHLMYSERSLSDGIARPKEQFFKQYRPKHPAAGGAPKMTANALGQGKHQIRVFRQQAEDLINAALKRYAPTKTICIDDISFEVENSVSCLSYADYNAKYGTQLKEVPQIPRWKLHNPVDGDMILAVQQQIAEIKRIREDNKRELYKQAYELAKQQQLACSASEAVQALSVYEVVNERETLYERHILELDRKAREVKRLAAHQDHVEAKHYLYIMERKQELLMQMLQLDPRKNLLTLAKTMIENDIKLIADLEHHWEVNAFELKCVKNSQQLKLNRIQEKLDVIAYREAQQAAPQPEPEASSERRQDWEPPGLF